MECFARLAPLVCGRAAFDRLVIVGGETSQAIFREIGVQHLELGRQLEPGVAQGVTSTECSPAANLRSRAAAWVPCRCSKK